MGFHRLSGKQVFSLAALAGWVAAWVADPFITIARLNVETWATETGLNKIYSWPFFAGWLAMMAQGIGWLYSLFVGPFGLGFALGAIVFAFWDPAARRLSSGIKGKLQIAKFHIANFILESKDSKIGGLMLRFGVHNHSRDTEIYFRIARAFITIDGRVNPDAKVEQSAVAVHPESTQDVTLAMVPELALKEMYSGQFEIVLHYGLRPEKMKFALEHDGVLTIQIDQSGGRQFTYKVEKSHRRTEHTKLH